MFKYSFQSDILLTNKISDGNEFLIKNYSCDYSDISAKPPSAQKLCAEVHSMDSLSTGAGPFPQSGVEIVHYVLCKHVKCAIWAFVVCNLFN